MKTPQRTGKCSSKMDGSTARTVFDFHQKKYLFQICLLKIHNYLILSCVVYTEFLEATFLIFFCPENSDVHRKHALLGIKASFYIIFGLFYINKNCSLILILREQIDLQNVFKDKQGYPKKPLAQKKRK